MTPRPVTTCGFPGPKRHAPHCTSVHRLVEGCWCAIQMGEEPIEKLTARQWRAKRRKHQRNMREFRRDYPSYTRWEDQLIRATLARRERERAYWRARTKRIARTFDVPMSLLDTPAMRAARWRTEERVAMTILRPDPIVKVTAV